MGVRAKTNRFPRLSLHMILFLTMVCGFLFFGNITIQAQAECTVEYNGGIDKKTVNYYMVYKLYPGEYADGDTLKITEDGEVYDLSYYLNDFYTADWKSLAECGYGIFYQWEEDYDFWSVDEHIGDEYSYRYYLYRVNEKGEPLDAEGNVAENAEDVDICAATEPVTLIAAEDHIETTINGILYFVYHGADYAEVIMCKGSLAGDVVLPKYVTIDGSSYPLQKVSSLASNPDITSVVIPDSVKEITDYAFLDAGLKEVTIPDSVQDIGSLAFGYTTSTDSETGELTIHKVPGFVIYGTYGSEAYAYAYNNGFSFVDRKQNAAAAKVKIKAKALKKKKVKLTWQKKAGVSGFEIYKAARKNGKYKKAATLKKAAASSWTRKFATVGKGKKLYFKVRPYTMINGKKIYGKWSNTAAVKIRK